MNKLGEEECEECHAGTDNETGLHSNRFAGNGNIDGMCNETITTKPYYSCNIESNYVDTVSWHEED